MGHESGHSDGGQQCWRCFFGALLEAESERRLAAVLTPLCNRAEDGLRWIPRVNWHLTLHFLGPASRAQIVTLGAALRERSLPAPLTLALLEIAPFPRSRPRTLAARLETSAALLDWVAYLRNQAALAGFQSDDRAFRAHLTVARPRRGRASRFPRLAEQGALRFDRIALMRSDLSAGGAVYRPLTVVAADPGSGTSPGR